jgi:hypothetical protein
MTTKQATHAPTHAAHPAKPATHAARPAAAPKHVENSTDATQGEPLAVRGQKRRAELELALAKVPADEPRVRSDIELAMNSFDELLTGDLEHLSDATGAAMNRLLENTKHLAEAPPKARRAH